MAATDNATGSYFAGLLEQSRKLRETTDAADLPPIQLGLGEIERRAKELRKAPAGAQSDTRAHYLLAAGGFNPDEALKNLEAFDAQAAYEPSTIPIDTDIDSYLRSRKEQNIMSSIEDGMRRTARDFDAFVAANVTMEWDLQKQKIFEHFGLVPKTGDGAAETTPGGGMSTFGSSSFGRNARTSHIGTPGGLKSGSIWSKSLGSSILGKTRGPASAQQAGLFADVDPSKHMQISRPVQLRQQSYAMAVRELNEARVAKNNYPIIQKFADITRKSGSDVLSLQLADSWKILECITGEQHTADGNPFNSSNNIREREFAKLHINVKPDSAEAMKLKKAVETGSRRYLERLFFRHVEDTIEKNPVQAKMGGIPSMTSKFKAYFNVKATSNEWRNKYFEFNPDGVPVWALVFYMIRAGFVQEAAAYVKEHHQYFQKIDRNFHLYINAYAKDPDRKLPRNLADHIQSDYIKQQREAENIDMFRIAAYKVIGRCDLAKRSLQDVLPTAEDWMWLQLVLTREADRAGEPAHEVFQLGDLQKSVLQFGAKHFSQKGSNVGLYFQMLLMSGLFEHAVQYLYSFQAVDAVHLAIALTFYGLLGVSSTLTQRPDSNLLTTGPLGDYRIDFARIIGQYIRESRLANIEDSVDYLCLICLNGDLPAPDGPAQLSLCHEALREIILESRDFSKLLGDVKGDGTRTKGAIERRMKLIKISDQKEYLRTITEQAATQADDDGRVQDSVLLYHLAEDYDTVLQVVNRNLSDWLAAEDPTIRPQMATVPQSEEQGSKSIMEIEDPEALSMHMLNMYGNSASIFHRISVRNRDACMVLIRIAEARKDFIMGQYEDCLNKIEGTDIIPISPIVDVGSIRSRAQNFSTLHDTVARNVGMLLILAVDSSSKLATQLKESAYADGAKAQKLQELRNRIKCAMIYAGMVQYKLPANVYERITYHDEHMGV